MQQKTQTSRYRLCMLLLCLQAVAFAQSSQVPTSRAHSHNDYLQKRPFDMAYEKRFGSLEADLFLRHDTLFVAHEKREISKDRTFEKLYLQPIIAACSTRDGSIYENPGNQLQLLIDLKTSYEGTLTELVKVLEPHKPLWFPAGTVKIVISGNTPPPDKFKDYPDYIFFDGRPEVEYQEKHYEKIGLISQSFTKYSRWGGEGNLPEEDLREIKKIIESAHSIGKPFRFWANPDNPGGWKTLLDLKVDYLNTDKIDELASYLNQKKP